MRAEDWENDLDFIAQEGWNACVQGMDFIDNPYSRDTVEWEAWRKGWVEADYSVWQGVLMDKRKASTE